MQDILLLGSKKTSTGLWKRAAVQISGGEETWKPETWLLDETIPPNMTYQPNAKQTEQILKYSTMVSVEQFYKIGGKRLDITNVDQFWEIHVH